MPTSAQVSRVYGSLTKIICSGKAIENRLNCQYGRIIIVLIRLIIIYSPRVKVERANEIIFDYKIDRSLRISGLIS